MSLRNKIAIGALTGVLGMTGALVTWFEGRSLMAYLDPVGIPTICEGVTLGVKLGDRATPAQCDQLLQRELRVALTAVDRRCVFRCLIPAAQPSGRLFTTSVRGSFPARHCCAC